MTKFNINDKVKIVDCQDIQYTPHLAPYAGRIGRVVAGDYDRGIIALSFDGNDKPVNVHEGWCEKVGD